MFTIRKRSLPTPKLSGILRKHDAAKKPRRSVGFCDDIGKPLVEYREIPSHKEELSEGPSSSSQRHEKTSGKFMSSWHVDNRAKWNVIPVKTAKPVRNGRSETGLIEEMRLEEHNISRAPLFGTFEAIEPGNLYMDSSLRAREAVPVIPVSDLQESAQQNMYEQVFEEQPAQKMTSLEILMSQLKERGLLPGALPPVGLVVPPMAQNLPPTRWNQRKPPQLCQFYINRRAGCNRGDNCRFRHDDQQRETRQRELQAGGYARNARNENWRTPVKSSETSPEKEKEKNEEEKEKTPSPNTAS